MDKAIAGNRSQDIAQAEAQLANDKAALRQAEEVLRQNQSLYTSGALARRDLDTSRATRDQAAAQVAKSQQALDLQRAGSRVEDVASARGQLLTAQGQLETIQAQINDTIIRAPFSGVVTQKYADPGSFVTPTTSASTVASGTSSSILALAATNQVNVNVAEANISQIKLGQPVKIEVDSYPGKIFTGRLFRLLPNRLQPKMSQALS